MTRIPKMKDTDKTLTHIQKALEVSERAVRWTFALFCIQLILLGLIIAHAVMGHL